MSKPETPSDVAAAIIFSMGTVLLIVLWLSVHLGRYPKDHCEQDSE